MCHLLIIMYTVPKSAQDNTSLDILSYTEYSVIIQFSIPVCIVTYYTTLYFFCRLYCSVLEKFFII